MKRVIKHHYSAQSEYVSIGTILLRLAILAMILLGYNLVMAESARGQSYTAKRGEILIVGTANTRSWGIESQNLDCSAMIHVSEDKLKSISSLAFTVDVKDLKGQNILMNRNAYKALKGYPFDKIRFNGVYFKTIATGENKYIIKAEGNLEIAGINKISSLTVTATLNPDGSVSCVGSKAISMSDFNVEIPANEKTRMDIGDEVILTFAINLVK